MSYCILLRGINIGPHKRVEMKSLINSLKNLGLSTVSSYLNTGNILVNQEINLEELEMIFTKALAATVPFEAQFIILSKPQFLSIRKKIPDNWNDSSVHTTNIAFLWPSLNAEDLIKNINYDPLTQDVISDARAIIFHELKSAHIPGATLPFVDKKVLQQVTIRNLNTLNYIITNLID